MNVGPQWIERTEPDPLLETQESPLSSDGAAQRVPSFTPVSPKAIPRAEFSDSKAASPVSIVKAPHEKTLAHEGNTQENTKLQEAAKNASWEKLSDLVSQCRACPMAATRKHCVFADGGPGCPIVIVGEAPGRDEDIEGIPFVGKSGQLLTRILECLHWKRGADVAIVNVLKCRPPNNRDPQPEEMSACAAFLDRQLELLDPKVVILMGRFAIDRLLGTDAAIGRLRGTAREVMIGGRRVPAVVTYHPSYLLRNPVEKEKSWQDFVLAGRLLSEDAP